MKKILFFTSMMLLLAISCSKDDGPSTPTTPTITNFTPTSGPVGTVVTINGTNFSTTAASNTVKIGSATATVSAATATRITATVPQGATTGTVSVAVSGKTATSSGNFTVTEEETPISVVLNSTALTLYPYPQYTGALEVTSDVGSETIVWSSSDETVATVDQNGLVTPLAVGTATITATAGTVAANATITVADGPVTSLELNNAELELFLDDVAALAIATLEADVDVELTGDPVWSSSDTGVATVDQNGNVTAVKLGTANITVTVDNASATAQVTVNPSVYVLGAHDNGAVVWKNGSEQILLPDVVDPAHLVVDDNGFIYVLDEEDGSDVPVVWQIDTAGKVTQTTPLEDPMANSYATRGLFLHNGDIYVGATANSNITEAAVYWVNGKLMEPFQGFNTFMYAFFVKEGVPYMIVRDTDTGLYAQWVDGDATIINAISPSLVFVSQLFVDTNDDVYFTVNDDTLGGLYINGIKDQNLQAVDPNLYNLFVEQGTVYISGEDQDMSILWTDGIPQTTMVQDLFWGEIFVLDGQVHVSGDYYDDVTDLELPAYIKNGVLIEDYFNLDNLEGINMGSISPRDIFVK